MFGILYFVCFFGRGIYYSSLDLSREGRFLYSHCCDVGQMADMRSFIGQFTSFTTLNA
jgi:hypothetical protein